MAVLGRDVGEGSADGLASLLRNCLEIPGLGVVSFETLPIS